MQKLILRHFNDLENTNLALEVKAFRTASPDNEAYYQQLKSIWDAASETNRLRGLDQKASVKNFKSKLQIHKQEMIPANSFSWLKYAAVIFLVAMVSLWIYLKENAVNYIEKETFGQIDSVALSDGSRIMLGKNSVIRYPEKFVAGKREIALLKGEAFFEVNKDAQRPFVIGIGPSTVTVLGTSFNISYSSSKIDVAVSTGRVTFAPNKASSSSILVAGEALSYHIRENSIERLSGINANSWYTNELYFVDMPLVEVCKELSQHFKVDIRLEEHKRSMKKFNANFKGSSLSEILEVLNATYKMKITTSGDTIIIRTIQ